LRVVAPLSAALMITNKFFEIPFWCGILLKNRQILKIDFSGKHEVLHAYAPYESAESNKYHLIFVQVLSNKINDF
jgi:hypothetical protein